MGGDQGSSHWPQLLSGRSLLVASLGLNLFFAGWLVGARVVPLGFGPPPGPMHQISEHLRQTLSAEGFRAVDRLIGVLDRRRERDFGRVGELRGRLKELLTQPTFDRDAFLQVFKDMNAEMSRGRAEADELIVDTVARLSPEDRRRLSELPLPPPPPGLGPAHGLFPSGRGSNPPH
jgi:uncharacterized membrane protein